MIRRENVEDRYEVEDISYESSHIDEVWDAIEEKIGEYFNRYKIQRGLSSDDLDFSDLSSKGWTIAKSASKKSSLNINAIIEDFEKDRKEYLEFLDMDSLEEFDYDPNGFKKELRNGIPKIRKTLKSKRKELDKFKIDFKDASSSELLEVVKNIVKLANEIMVKNVKVIDNEALDDYVHFDEEPCRQQGVIGGNIRTLFIHKMDPSKFPYRSASALWALYFLSGCESFGCEEGSEFVIFDEAKGTATENYWYPYVLFVIYAYEIYNWISQKIEIPSKYKYVIVEDFLSFVANEHKKDIGVLGNSDFDYYL